MFILVHGVINRVYLKHLIFRLLLSVKQWGINIANIKEILMDTWLMGIKRIKHG